MQPTAHNPSPSSAVQYGKRAPVAHTARYSSTANMHKRQPAYLLANKVRFLSSN